jgi:hypothetical protein
MRLKPGIGYRYARRGVCFNGVRQNATLNFEMHSAVQCSVNSKRGVRAAAAPTRIAT